MTTLLNIAHRLQELGDTGISHFARHYSMRDANNEARRDQLVNALAVLQIVNNAKSGDLPYDAASLLHEAQHSMLWNSVQLVILQETTREIDAPEIVEDTLCAA